MKKIKKQTHGNKGNQFGVALKDKDLRQEAYSNYCEWLTKGYPKKSWHFKNDKYHCSWETIEKYIQDKSEFDPSQMDEALAKRYTHYIDLGLDMMLGKVDKCQPAIFQMFMRNMFDWDKEASQQTGKSKILLEKLLEKLD
jgi:hypothetical protein